MSPCMEGESSQDLSVRFPLSPPCRGIGHGGTVPGEVWNGKSPTSKPCADISQPTGRSLTVLDLPV